MEKDDGQVYGGRLHGDSARGIFLNYECFHPCKHMRDSKIGFPFCTTKVRNHLRMTEFGLGEIGGKMVAGSELLKSMAVL